MAERRGLIDDNVGEAWGLAFAAFGWRNFAAMFGHGNVHELDYFGTLGTQSYLWAYGCGGGSYTSCAGVGTSSDFAANAPQAVFSPLYGSYFGDWDNTNNLLRAPLASEGKPLVCFWAGCPTWHVHHMALGNTIGHAARLTQNNDHEYTVSDGGRLVRIALMGDPTLKAHVVRPASGLSLSVERDGEVRLAWSASADAVEGYHVYRASGIQGQFERITAVAVADTGFVDTSPLAGNNVYMVRAVKLETSASGTYYNLSGGIVDSLAVEVGVPEIVSLSPCFPNPATPEVSIRYHLPSAGRVLLEVFSVSGRRVCTLEDAHRIAGWHTATWDGVDAGGHRAASGVYFCRLCFGDVTRTGRVTLLR